jgi:hypothetical protein
MSKSNWGDMTISELEKVHKILASMYPLDVPLVAYQPTDMAAFNWKIGRASVAEDVKRTISAKRNRQ